MDADRRVMRAESLSGETLRARWFSGSLMTPRLLETANRRLGLLALAASLVLLSGFVVFFNFQESFIEGFDSRVVSISAIVFSVFVSLLVYVVSRVKRIRASLVLDIGVAYQILFGLGIAVAQRMESWHAYAEFRGFSCVALWLICYAVIVPGGTMVRITVSAFVTALMDPLGLFINVAFGLPMPPLIIILGMFVPTLLSVVVAVFCAGIVFRLGQDVQRAKQMGSYQLAQLLGRGGMGEVWRAHHHMLARPAAIKLIRPEILGTNRTTIARAVLQRFEREAQATAQLQSEHSVLLYDFGMTDDGSLYYVMELLEGMDMEKLVERFGPLCPERVVFLLLQVCDSLMDAHERNLVHRDIKPANIFVCRMGQKYDFIKVLDFGLVKKAADFPHTETNLTAQDTVKGTPAYLPPEIIMGDKKPDHRADIYALGCVAYWLLSGYLLFTADSAIKMMMAHVNTDPIRLTERSEIKIPASLEDTVHLCLAKDPQDRIQSVAELADRLTSVEFDESWTPEKAKRWWKTHLGEESGFVAS